MAAYKYILKYNAAVYTLVLVCPVSDVSVIDVSVRRVSVVCGGLVLACWVTWVAWLGVWRVGASGRSVAPENWFFHT